MAQLEELDKDTLGPFLDSPVCVLILAKTGCAACAAWGAELTAFLATLGDDDPLSGVRYGKLILNQRGLSDFKKASPWLQDVKDLPFNVLYRDGENVRSFAGGGTERLVNRLKRVLPA